LHWSPEARRRSDLGGIVTYADQPRGGGGSEAVFFIVDVTTARLNVIAELFDTKKLTPQIGAVLPLAGVQVAHQMLAGAPDGRGKDCIERRGLGRLLLTLAKDRSKAPIVWR